jgi:hypothetical protein
VVGEGVSSDHDEVNSVGVEQREQVSEVLLRFRRGCS